MTEKHYLKGLDCPSCANKIEEALNRDQDLAGSKVNYANQMLEIDHQYEEKAQKIIDDIEPGVTLVTFNEAHKRKWRNDLYTMFYSKDFIKMVLAAALVVIGLVYRRDLQALHPMVDYGVFMGAYVLVGSSVVWSAVRSVMHGQVFNEKFLMTVATLGAIAIGELPEAVAVMLFFAVGNFMQELAVNRSRRSIKSLLDLRSDYAHVIQDGQSLKVPPEEVEVGEVIMVYPGEKIPLDGTVDSGESYVDMSALTGEPLPKRVEKDSKVFAGTVNEHGLLRITVRNSFGESSVHKILDLVENATSQKAPTEKMITQFSKWYTPLVIGLALLIAVMPPLLISHASFSDWAYRALVLLVISCPCALVISIPLSYFGGIGRASQDGILVKGANYLDGLYNLNTIVLDKTGTITKGTFKVSSVIPQNGYTDEQLMEWAAIAEAYSHHPIARAIKQRTYEPLQLSEIESFQEIKGYGVKTTLKDGTKILAGNGGLMAREGIDFNFKAPQDTTVHVAVNHDYVGYIELGDEIKGHAPFVMKELKQLGVQKIVMLTGDAQKSAKRIADLVGITEYHAELLPEDKLIYVDNLAQASGKGKIAFVGDGMNDAPVIARADVGIAMGALGTDAAIEAADIVLMDDQLEKLPQSLMIAQKTRHIVLQNIVLALGVKFLFIALGAVGLLGMWEAVFADVGVTLIAILNATRTLRLSKTLNDENYQKRSKGRCLQDEYSTGCYG